MNKKFWVVFLILVTPVLVLQVLYIHFYCKEKKALYQETMSITLIYKPAKQHITWTGRSMLGFEHERYIVILKWPDNIHKRIIESKNIYQQLEPYDGQKVIMSWREHPFRIITIKLKKEE